MHVIVQLKKNLLKVILRQRTKNIWFSYLKNKRVIHCCQEEISVRFTRQVYEWGRLSCHVYVEYMTEYEIKP